MFVEYKNVEGTSAKDFIEALFENRHKNPDCTAIMMDESPTTRPIALIHMDLFWAFHFLVNALADLGVNMDAHLSNALQENDLSFGVSIMQEFVRFRKSMGLEISGDDQFLATQDMRIYTKDTCMCPPEYSRKKLSTTNGKTIN